MEDLVYLAAGFISSIIIIGSAVRVRSGPPGHGMGSTLGSHMILDEGIGGLKPFRVAGARTYRVRLGEYLDELGDGAWDCILVGRGGWGAVYKCSRPGVVYAVKVPIGYETIIEGGEPPTVSQRVMDGISREAELIAGIRHRHIVKLIAYSKIAPILVYEYANNGSIEYQLGNGWRPSMRDSIVITAQIGDALRYIHSRGLVHGDIKAGNILLVNGVAKLGDFSTLTRLLQTISTSRSAYTYGWRAPEQVYSDLRAKSTEMGLENKIDIYQLGNMLLYMLTGEKVDGEKRVGRDRILWETIGRIGNEELRQLTWKMLQTNPWDRPTAEEVVKELIEIYNRMYGR